MTDLSQPPVLVEKSPGLLALVLNRPAVLNTLNLEMIRLLRQVLDEALDDAGLRLVLLRGAGERGFCAGGDLKALARAVREQNWVAADRFFREEYALDLLIHEYPRPVLALADGIVMGGGLGLVAGAEVVVATERTRMAMPKTRIGFFPDVGATGWLFDKCLPGYPEYLSLTGYELRGGDCVRVGLATHLVEVQRLPDLLGAAAALASGLSGEKTGAVAEIEARLTPLTVREMPADPEKDAWVAEHFAGKRALGEILASLRRCRRERGWCAEVLQRLSERSPTALALTLQLRRANEGRPLPEVLHREALAADFMIRHPDYLEGIRARIIDKDDRPRWQPATLPEVADLQVELQPNSWRS